MTQVFGCGIDFFVDCFDHRVWHNHWMIAPTPAEILEAYKKLSAEEANEAETRIKLIDQIIFGVLGWTHDDVHVEPRVSEDGVTTFADYHCATAMTQLVIEAKKVGESFEELPDIRRARLRGKIVEGVTGATIKQARDYARGLSVGFAIVTNGAQWVVFPVNRRDGVKFSDSSAVIFPDIESVLHDDFAEFYDLLSREAVIRGSLESELLGRIEDQIEQRRLNRHFQRTFTRRSKVSFYDLIQNELTLAFNEETVSADADLLEKCYVQTPERIKFDSRIKMYVQRREMVAERPKRPLKKDNKALTEIIDAAATRARPLAVLVIGLVGAGKTTFLNYTRKVSARDLLVPDPAKPYPHWIYVDHRDLAPGEPPLPFLLAKLREHIANEEFLSDYQRCIQHAYRTEIDALLRGPLHLLSNDEGERRRRIADLLMKDYEAGTPYVEKILSYASKNAPVFLVIDNVDQFEADGIQSQIFSDTMAFSRRIGANLVLAMRDATYVKHRSTPVLDAFDFDPIYIDPPEVEAVISKRFFVARQLLEGKPLSFITENGARMEIRDSAILIDLIKSSVLGTEVGEIIDVLASSDIRLALRMTREFLQYGYTATGYALEVYQRTGTFQLPKHEAIRAIMLGNQSIYQSSHSVIQNPFDANLGRSEAQLLRLYVLTALVQYGSERAFEGLPGEQIRDNMRSLGFSDDITLAVLKDLANARFVLTLSHGDASFESTFTASRLGGHVVRHFISTFAFLENVLMDTFISSDEVWTQMYDLANRVFQLRDRHKKIQLRAELVQLFFDYMQERFHHLTDESIRRGLAKEWCSNPFKSAESQFNTNIQAVLASATRQFSKNY